ncbi:MAG TPA: nucleotidyltransferase family protein [Anaeromyxobacteraceae bacterium]|nr:nucleotidyltransferase family protein [Anaeromyxobacteraceae bacterium]
MPLSEAIRALSAFDPPAALPDVDLALLAEVLEVNGLAPIASYHLESRPLGAGVPAQFREKLLALYQGVVNDNVYRVMTIRGALKASPVPVVALGGLAAVDWLYPHLAFRPLGDVRLAVRGRDGGAFTEAARGAGFSVEDVAGGGRGVAFGDGRVRFTIQEGLWAEADLDAPLFARATPLPALGPRVLRPAPEEMLLSTVGEQAEQGLYAPLVTFVDLRELLRQDAPLDAAHVARRAAATGLSRALHGSLSLLTHHFPEVAPAARALLPALSAPERAAVDAIVRSASDPARLTHLRGAQAAARLAVLPR